MNHMTHAERIEKCPIVVKGRDKQGNRIELKFPTKKWASFSKAYWRLFDAFNPDFPDAEKVELEEIAPLLIDLVEASKDMPTTIKDSLREILTGDLSLPR